MKPKRDNKQNNALWLPVVLSLIMIGVMAVYQLRKNALVESLSKSPRIAMEAIHSQIFVDMLSCILILVCVALIIFYILWQERKRLAQISSIQNQQLVILSTDKLTGLLNENGFVKRAQDVLKNSHGEHYFIIDADVNSFAAFNKLYGVDKCDQILIKIARHVKQTLSGNELLARIYADRFVAMLCEADLETLQTRIRKANDFFCSVVKETRVLVSFGIYEVCDVSIPVNNMIYYAREAKRSVKGNYDKYIGIYNDMLVQRKTQNGALVAKMETALERGEFIAYYQPVVDAKNERVIGAEALARWWHNDELVHPSRFIELFERHGLIAKLDYYMLEMVCTLLEQLKGDSIPCVPISVNFSRVHIYESDFISKVLKIIDKHGVDPKLIGIEFTETVILENAGVLLPVVHGFQEKGISISIDDFGSGYSSLNVLKDVAADIVKLDKEFLNYEGPGTYKAEQIVFGAITLIKNLNMAITAEGVETQEQLDMLREAGCSYIQGFYFSKPITKDMFAELLRTGAYAAVEKQ